MKRGYRAFTLIELLMVLVIIIILASFLFPSFIRMKDSTRCTQDASQLKQIIQSMIMYTDEHEGRWVPLYETKNPCSTLLPGNKRDMYCWPCSLLSYVKSKDIFQSPADHRNKSHQEAELKNLRDSAYIFGLFPSWGYNANFEEKDSEAFVEVQEKDSKPASIGVMAAKVSNTSGTLVLANSTYYQKHEKPKDDVGFFKIYPPSTVSSQNVMSLAPPKTNVQEYLKWVKEKNKSASQRNDWEHLGHLRETKTFNKKEACGTSYGHVWPRHKGNTAVNAAFADGHVESLELYKFADEDGVRMWLIEQPY